MFIYFEENHDDNGKKDIHYKQTIYNIYLNGSQHIWLIDLSIRVFLGIESHEEIEILDRDTIPYPYVWSL